MKPQVKSFENVQRFSHPADWEDWLEKHHADATGVWLLIAKKGCKGPGLTISDALDVALCHGWIDSQRKGYDETHYLQRYSPRRSQSPWSKLNVERAGALIAEGRMRDAGIQEIEKAKVDGRWEVAYESQREAETPADVVEALAAAPRARVAFDAMSKSARYAVILPILKATKPEVRSRRLRKMISGLDG